MTSLKLPVNSIGSLSVILISILLIRVDGSGVFEIQIMSLQKNDPKYSSSSSINSDEHQRLTSVFVCLKEPFTDKLDGPCTFGNSSIVLGQIESNLRKTMTTSKTNDWTNRAQTNREEEEKVNGDNKQNLNQYQQAKYRFQAQGNEPKKHNETRDFINNNNIEQVDSNSNGARIPFTFRWEVSLERIL